MAVGFRASSGSSVSSGFSNVSSQNLTLSGNIVAGDLVAVAVAVGDGVTFTANTPSLSGAGVTWASAGTAVLGGGNAFGTGVTLAVFTATAAAGTPGAAVTASPAMIMSSLRIPVLLLSCLEIEFGRVP